MSNMEHKTELINITNDLMTEIDTKNLHPKNKILLYSRYVLSKVSWHFTVADLSKTWVTENIDNIVSRYIRKWLEIPVSGTLSNVFLPINKFGLSIIPPSIRFTQCQVTLRKILKNSPNDDIQQLWRSTAAHTNIQYDAYKSTKEIIKEFHQSHEEELCNRLSSQGLFYRTVSKYSLSTFNKVWALAQCKLPKNIYNFTIRYINNTLPTRKNLVKWGISSSSDCSFCLLPESILHVVSGCKVYLNQGRYTWRHDSILQFIARTLSSTNVTMYADLPSFNSPSVITGDSQRPDLLIATSDKQLYILELTVGHETNLDKNLLRKQSKYRDLLNPANYNKSFNRINFVNLSISALGILSKESSTFIDMLENLGLDDNIIKYATKKISSIAIRSTYYIFCCRNKEWSNPELLHY